MKYQLTDIEHRKVFESCQKKKIDYMWTPWDVKSVDLLENL